jgi:hypothetical protein
MLRLCLNPRLGAPREQGCRRGRGGALFAGGMGAGLGRVLALAVLLLPFGLRAATFTASLDRDAIYVGESATLSLSFEGGQPADPVSPPAVPNLQITPAGTSRQISIDNGRSTTILTYSFQVFARQPGDYSIPAVTAVVDGQRLRTQPLTLKVLKPNAPSPQAINSGSQVAFIRLVLPRKEVFVGETIVAQLHFYLLSRLQGNSQLQPTSFPADGLSPGKMVEIEGQRRQTQVGNSVYTIIPVSVPLKVVKTGALTIGPATFNLVVSQRDPFDPFGMFGSGKTEKVALASDTVTLQSLPLPRENAPTDFNGAIGVFTMDCSVGPTNVAAGDPITVKVQIAGRGNVDSLTLPEQAGWRDFKTYPPTSKVETTDQFGLQGSKTFEQVVTPQNADLKALPAISFSFFDPEKKTYRTLTHPAVPIVVRPGGAMPAPTVFASPRPGREAPAPSQDIVPNKQRLGELAQIRAPLVQRPWFLAVQAVPVVAFALSVLWRRRIEMLAHNPRLRRQRLVAQIITDGQASLRALAAQNKSDDFFATLFRLLQEQLGERLDVPASAITEAVIEERLRPGGAPEPVLARLQELFQVCNLARYAPIKTSQELAAIVPKFETVIRDLKGMEL